MGTSSLLTALILNILLLPSALRADGALDDNLDFLKNDAQQMVQSSFNKLGKPANRDFHSRGVCLKGTFTTFPQNFPDEGIDIPFFSTAGTYPMYGRFSNGLPGRKSKDHLPSVFGFGIKVIGVPGEKFDMQSLGSTKPKNSNQDWNLATGATFPIADAATYRQFRELGEAGFARKHPILFKNVIDGLIHIDSFFTTPYFSQVALHFGDKHIAKFSARPCDKNEKTISLARALLRSERYTTENLLRDAKSKEGCFDFYAQYRPIDENLKKVIDPTKLWPVDRFPMVKLAEIKFPANANVEKLQDYCEESLSFNPGNALQALRPIEEDTLMRSRFLAAYEGSVTKRTELNKGKQTEPAPIGKGPEELKKWLAETKAE